MADTKSVSNYLKDDLSELIGQLDLGDPQKRYLRSRWLDQVLWMEGKAGRTQIRYYALRITAIIGGVIVPALVGLNFSEAYDFYVRGAAFILGLMVAISVAVEEFFHYGERWRHYRSTVEVLKSEGWQFFQLSGRYGQHANHDEAYREFADQVEQILNAEVTKFITEVVVERKREEPVEEEADEAYVGDESEEDAYAESEVSPDTEEVADFEEDVMTDVEDEAYVEDEVESAAEPEMLDEPEAAADLTDEAEGDAIDEEEIPPT